MPDKLIEPETPPTFGEGVTETKVFEDNLDKSLIKPDVSSESEKGSKAEANGNVNSNRSKGDYKLFSAGCVAILTCFDA